MGSIDSVGVCKALWTYKGLDPIYHFSCPLRVDNAVNLLSLLWDQINYRSLFLLRNCIKGVYCLLQNQPRSLSSTSLGLPAGQWQKQRNTLRAWVFMCLPSLPDLSFFSGGGGEDNSTKILALLTIIPISGPFCGFDWVFSPLCPLCFNVFTVSDWQVCQMELFISPFLYASQFAYIIVSSYCKWL